MPGATLWQRSSMGKVQGSGGIYRIGREHRRRAAPMGIEGQKDGSSRADAERTATSPRVLAKLEAGDPDALGAVYDEFSEELYELAYRLTQSAADANDILHDVFLGLPEALRIYDGEGSFGAWLRRIMVRSTLMRLRRKKRLREVPLSVLYKPATGMAGFTAPDEMISLEDAVGRLPDYYRTVLVLKEVEGYSHKEIAELLGIRVGTSMVRLCRARKLLRDMLDL